MRSFPVSYYGSFVDALFFLVNENVYYRVWVCAVLMISSLPGEGLTGNGRH
jgi:hypothetical protein